MADARKRDINEADTSHLVMDILCDVFGYKKIEEITSEHAIKGTFADLVVKVGNAVRFLVEVKAINTELKESHVTQVVNYAANLPADWVVLTNAARWQAYKVNFNKPIGGTLVLDVDFCANGAKDVEASDLFGGLSREVFTSDSLSQMFKAKQAMSRYSIAQLLLSDPVVAIVRRELRKLADGLNPDIDQVRTIIQEQVLKRELIEADEAKAAAKAVKRLNKHTKTEKPASQSPSDAAAEAPSSAAAK
ncbi:MAG: type I restriction enzyme HsdR N-terminal domain-containing protein [Rhizomicrobium sp.]